MLFQNAIQESDHKNQDWTSFQIKLNLSSYQYPDDFTGNDERNTMISQNAVQNSKQKHQIWSSFQIKKTEPNDFICYNHSLTSLSYQIEFIINSDRFTYKSTNKIPQSPKMQYNRGPQMLNLVFPDSTNRIKFIIWTRSFYMIEQIE